MRSIIGCLCVIGGLMLAAIPALAQDATSTPEEYHSTGLFPLPILYVALDENICVDDLIAANRNRLPSYLFEEPEQEYLMDLTAVRLPSNRVIPPHDDCYREPVVIDMDNEAAALVQIEKDHNVCVEDFIGLIAPTSRKDVLLGRPSSNKLDVYLRKSAPPCINDKGQRLQYYGSDGKRLDAPFYSDVPFVETPLDEMDMCLNDLIRANPAIQLNPYFYSLGPLPYTPGMRLFVPKDARHCKSVLLNGRTLGQISQDMNVCMEAILDATGAFFDSFWTPVDGALYVPVDTPPCYDEAGHRVGQTDRDIYIPQLGESFLDIAQAYKVCLDDLWAANPIMEYWTGWSYSLPDIIFIPDTPPCDGSQTYTVRGVQTYHTISLLTNTCFNRLEDANPALTRPVLDPLPEGQRLTIPNRPHCYDFVGKNKMANYNLAMQNYACYAQPVTAESDFRGSEPPVSVSSNSDLPYCYPREEGMTVIYNNAPYTLYRMRGYESALVLSQCFGVPTPDFYVASTDSLNDLTPGLFFSFQDMFLLVPEPHADCNLLNVDDQVHQQRYREITYKAGSLHDGVYTVNYGDTLSSIGRRFGYLPQWIADANGLDSTHWVYYLQDLKLPLYPSLYTLAPLGGAAGVIVLVSSTIYGVRRLSRRRGKDKKKNDA